MKASLLASYAGATVQGAEPQEDILRLLTDSRSLTVAPNTLFVALQSEGNDGHLYLQELYGRGVRHFLVTSAPQNADAMPRATFYVVRDTREALQHLGSAIRRGYGGETLAITGSRGKTLLKEWVYQLLEPSVSITRSPRSYNSQIGVPLSLWEVTPQTQLLVVEAGISRSGEMARLAEMIDPQTVVLTGLTEEHDAGFADRGAKAREKLLLARDSASCRLLLAPAGEAALEELRQSRPDIELFTWGPAECNPSMTIEPGADGRSLRWRVTATGESGEAHFPFRVGDYEETASALLALMYRRGSLQAADFSRLYPIGTRIDVQEGVNNCSVLCDNFTCDVASLAPSLDFMHRRLTEDRTAVVVLADPVHGLNDKDKRISEIAALLRDAEITRFIGVGPLLAAHRGMFGPEALLFADESSLLETLSTSDFADQVVLLKGSPAIPLTDLRQRLETRTHETVLEVNLDAIVKNFNYFRSHLPIGTGLIAMVKASGYGAGSYEIARTMQDHGAAYLAVAVLDEGIELRRRGIHTPIMVMNPKVVNYKSLFAFSLEPEIYSLEMLRDVVREGRKYGVSNYPVHIKLDTGMHRMGFVEEELDEVLAILAGQQTVQIRSVFSHLATADCPDMDDYTLRQLQLFDRLTTRLQSSYPHRFMRHILNSAGILRFPEYHYDMARLGIGLYGVNTLPPEMEEPLATVSRLRTVIIAIREWQPGETIGYGRRGVITRPSRIATIPIGYADGMNRHFGRGALKVLVNGCWAPTIGNVCMDACMIDVTDVECSTGDTVEIFGPNADIQRMADVLDTIPYEVLTSVSPRVRRIYYRE